MKDYAEHTIMIDKIMKAIRKEKLKGNHLESHGLAMLLMEEARFLEQSLRPAALIAMGNQLG